MRATRQRDTKPELALRRTLHSLGLRYRVDQRPVADIRRRADVVFAGVQVAVFVDGCFWHGCPEHGTWPAANAKWWRDKIEGNKQRDADTNARLAQAGWTVLRIWEHEDTDEAAVRVVRVVSRRSTT